MSKIKEWSSGLLGVVIIVAFGLIIGLVFKGAIWFTATVLPIVQIISGFLFFVNLLVLLPLCFVRKTRGYSGLGMYISSYIFGLELWLRALLFTYIIWGGFWVVVGLLFAGIGILPLSLLATAFDGSWTVLFWLCVGMITTYGSRILGQYFVNKDEEEQDHKQQTAV
ncbi:MAG: hypothetical protein AAB391_01080 [Patescibacteria group bacterium]